MFMSLRAQDAVAPVAQARPPAAESRLCDLVCGRSCAGWDPLPKGNDATISRYSASENPEFP